MKPGSIHSTGDTMVWSHFTRDSFKYNLAIKMYTI